MFEIQNALHSLPSGEHLTARRATRLKFVQREAEQLKQYVEDLENSLKLNKKLLQELFQSKSDDTEDTQSRISPRNAEQLLIDIKNLEEEIKQANQEKEAAEGIALINEQIAAECTRKEQELISEYEEKLQELEYQNEKKERIIKDLETRNKQLAGDADLYKKSQHLIVAPPHEQLLDLITLTERRRQIMQRLARDLHWARTHREMLHENCKFIWEELQKAQALLKNPINRRAGVDRVFLPKKDMSFDDILDRRESVSSSSEDSLPEPPFPDKFRPQTQGQNNQVPILDFTKLNRAVSIGADVMNDSFIQENQGEVKQARQLLDNYRDQIETLTQQLLEISKENSELQGKNFELVEKLQNSQQSIRLLNDTLKQVKKIDHRQKMTSEIITDMAPSVAFKLRRESGSSSEEIVIRSEAFYGEDQKWQILNMNSEYSLIRVPFELLSSYFHHNKRTVEKEISFAGTHLKNMKRSNEFLQRDQVIATIQALSSRLKGMKNQIQEVNQKQNEIVDTMVNRIRAVEDQGSLIKQKLSRLIAEYLLRQEMFELAQEFADHSQISLMIDKEIFQEAQEIINQLKQHILVKALDWCESHKSKLRKIGSMLEFSLKLQKFIEHVKAGNTMAAIRYARSGLSQYQDQQEAIQQAFVLIILNKDDCQDSYKELLSDAMWDKLIEMFKKDMLKVYGLSQVGNLEIYLQTGLSIIKTPLCGIETNLNEECPTCNELYAKLISHIPSSTRNNSSIICRITGLKVNEDNPMIALPNGQAFSQAGIEQIQENGKVTCPITGDIFSSSTLRKVFIL